MRALLAGAALALLPSCWEEGAVLDQCVRVGRCATAPVADAGEDAGAETGAQDAGQPDAGPP